MMLIYFTFFFAASVITAYDIDTERVLRSASDGFTARMTYEIGNANPRSSYVLSAFSVMPLLGQLAVAASGETHDELLTNIGMPNDETIETIFSGLNTQLHSSRGVEFRMANRIYVANQHELNDHFDAVSRKVFNSEVKRVDFSKNLEVANNINKWVEHETNDRIKNLVDSRSLSASTRAVLVNAIYFKSKWKNPFEKGSTTLEDFYVTKDNIKKIPTMYKNDDYRYGESEELKVQLLEIPYIGSNSSMLFILPNEVDGISQLQDKLKDPNIFSKLDEILSLKKIEIHIPKFKIETTTNLQEVLEKMGVKRMFSPQLSQLDHFLKDPNFSLSGAVQKAFIEVDEEGAEAAAANAFVVGASFNPQRTVFKANRPFFFMIKMNSLPLFTGVMRG